nr:MAG: capsid protein [Cressdnaviricota sp.]
MYSRKGTGMRTARRTKTVSRGTANKILAAVGANVSSRSLPRGGVGLRRGDPAGEYGRRFRGGELKSVDFPVASAPATATLNATLYVQALNVIQVGSAFYNRIGNDIEMKSLHLIGQIAISGNVTGPTQEYIRIMIIYDRQPNGNYPAIADVLTNYDNAGTTTSNSYCHLNPNNADRFKILMDNRIDIPYNSGAADFNQAAEIFDYTKNEVNINRFIPLRGLLTKYKASSSPAVIGDQATGALLLFCLGSVASGAEGYNFKYTSRIRYRD